MTVCEMPRDPGPCEALLLRYYYDPRDRTCSTFDYGGCQGNENRFETLEECQRECMGGMEEVMTTPAPTPGRTQAPATDRFECEYKICHYEIEVIQISVYFEPKVSV